MKLVLLLVRGGKTGRGRTEAATPLILLPGNGLGGGRKALVVLQKKDRGQQWHCDAGCSLVKDGACEDKEQVPKTLSLSLSPAPWTQHWQKVTLLVLTLLPFQPHSQQKDNWQGYYGVAWNRERQRLSLSLASNPQRWPNNKWSSCQEWGAERTILCSCQERVGVGRKGKRASLWARRDRERYGHLSCCLHGWQVGEREGSFSLPNITLHGSTIQMASGHVGKVATYLSA